MARAPLDFDAVLRIGLTLPDVVEGTMYGAPALKVQGNLLACVPANKSAEPNSAVVRIDFEPRAALLEAHPEIYYLTHHYADHPMVLVRLSHIGREDMRDLLGLALQFVSSSAPARGVRTVAKRTAAKARSARPKRPVRKP